MSNTRSTKSSTNTTTVYKIGGSLLSVPDLGSRIGRVLQQRPHTQPLLIVGGGPTADIVREWDRIHQLGEERSHHLALKSMALNEALLAELLPNSQIVTNRNGSDEAHATGRIPILSALQFLRDEEPVSETPLPHHWDVTSDAIAAWITHRWPAEELVLLKSRPPTNEAGTVTRHETQLVDPYFPRLASLVPVISWVDAGAPEPKIERWEI